MKKNVCISSVNEKMTFRKPPIPVVKNSAKVSRNLNMVGGRKTTGFEKKIVIMNIVSTEGTKQERSAAALRS